MIELKIINSLIPKFIPLPAYQTDGSAGIDIHACMDYHIIINPGETKLIGSGFALHIGNPNIVAILFARSGLSVKHGIVLANAVGIIDSDFQGEIKVALYNHSNKGYEVKPGERIAQLVFMGLFQQEFKVVEKFSNETLRGENGFGHTGKF
jgi:dUTP pyrophosphatase